MDNMCVSLFCVSANDSCTFDLIPGTIASLAFN